MKFAVVVLTSVGNSKCFAEVGETLVHGLRTLGHDCTDLLWGRFRDNSINIVLAWNMIDYVPSLIAPPGSVLYNLEQMLPALTNWTPVKKWLGNPAYRIWDYSLSNIRELNKIGIKGIKHLPIGYYPGLTKFPQVEQNVDVVFVGHMNERRNKIFEEIRRLGLTVHQVNGLYGAQRDNVLARAKVHLNMHWWHPQCVFEEVRCSYLLANGGVVVSENGDFNGERPYANVIKFTDFDGLARTCADVVRLSAGDRKIISEQGLALMRSRIIEAFLDPLIKAL